MTDKFNIKRALILAGAVIAFTIGSGFATGQEIIQYFTAYGIQALLAVAFFAVAFLYYNINFANAGTAQKFEKGNDVYKYYCGKYVGTFMDYYSTLFCYLSFFVMVGGAASTLNQEYGLPSWVGAVVLVLIVVITVVGGLNSVVDSMGIVGPIIIVLCLAIGIYTLVQDGSNLSEGFGIIESGSFAGAAEGETIQSAGDNWLMSGASYAGFVLLWFASFTTALGAKNGKKNLLFGIIAGTVVVCLAIIVLSFAQVTNINTVLEDGSAYVWNADIPNLILASNIWKPFSAIFAIVVFAGIYTTAVPLLYNPVARFATEGTARFRILAIVLGIVGLLVGLFLPYKMLVNVIYVINGYIGAILIIFMIVKNVRDLWSKRRGLKQENSLGQEEFVDQKELADQNKLAGQKELADQNELASRNQTELDQASDEIREKTQPQVCDKGA